MGKDDEMYLTVKRLNPELYASICAFASVVGSPGDDIDISTRYSIERFCMSLVLQVPQ